MNRKENFWKLKDHSYYCKQFRKLSRIEITQCLQILKDTETLSKDDYCTLILRLWVDSKEKPKNRHLMVELLLASK